MGQGLKDFGDVLDSGGTLTLDLESNLLCFLYINHL